MWYNFLKGGSILMKKKLLVGFFAIAMCFILVGCGKANSNKEIVGQWKNAEYGSQFIYTFQEDGTGEYDSAGTIMKFKYTIDGNKISFKYEDKDMDTLDTTFSIDGDTLNVKDSNNEDILYKKVK